MNEEGILKILSKLAEGKLTAKEAQEMLLQVRTGGRAASFASTVESAVNSAMESATEAVRNTGVAWGELRQEAKGRRIVVRASGCALEARRHTGTEVVVQNLGWPARLTENDEEIVLDVVGAKATLLVPGDCPLNITISGCKVNLMGLDVPVAIYGVGCDIRYDAPRTVQLDAHLDAGNLDLRLPENADPRVHVDCMMGRVSLPEGWISERHHGTWVRRPRRRETQAYVDVRITAGKMTVTLEPVNIPIDPDETPAPPMENVQAVSIPIQVDTPPAPPETQPSIEEPVAAEEAPPTPAPAKARKKKGKSQKSRP